MSPASGGADGHGVRAALRPGDARSPGSQPRRAAPTGGGPERVGEGWLVMDVVKRLRRKLGDDAQNPKYIFTVPRAGYWMAAGDTPEQERPQAETE